MSIQAERDKILKAIEQEAKSIPVKIAEVEASLAQLHVKKEETEGGDLRENSGIQRINEMIAQNNNLLKNLSNRQEAWKDFSLLKNTNSEVVNPGSTVHLIDLDNNKEYYFILVERELADSQIGALSMQTEVGKRIIGKEKGTVVEVDTPSGRINYKIEEVI